LFEITGEDGVTTGSFQSALDSRINVSIPKSQKRGAVAIALESELEALRSQERWYEGEKFPPNHTKVVALQLKLGATQKALNYLKEYSWKEATINPSAYTFRKSLKIGDGSKIRKAPDNHNLYVWRYRGSASKMSEVFDYNKLEFVANVKKGWSYRQKDDGSSYIELRNPLMPTDMTQSELRQSMALMQITAEVTSKDVVSHMENPALSEIEFIDSSVDLVRNLNQEGYESSQLVNKNRARRQEIYSRAKTKSQRGIDAHMRKWAFKDGAFDVDKVEQIVRYLISPSSVEGFTTVHGLRGNRMDFPTYKVNKRLFTEIFEFLDNNGMGGKRKNIPSVTESIVEDWNAAIRGEGAEFEMDKKLYNKGFSTEYNALEEVDLNMARHLSGYSDPMIRQFFDNNGLIVPTKRVEFQNAEGARGFIRFLKRGTVEKPWCRGG
jgi:hypothetical protein